MYLHLPTHDRTWGDNRSNPWTAAAYFQPPFSAGFQSPRTSDPVLRRQGMLRGLGDGQVDPQTDALIRQLEQQHGQRMADAMSQIAASMEEDVKKEIMKTSAVQTGVSLALSAIPVAGWAAAAIFSVIASIGSSKYKREAQEIMADAESQVMRIQARSQKRINAMILRVFEEEKPGAIRLAVQGTAPAGTLDGFGSFVKRTFNKVGDAFKDATRALERATEPVRDEARDISRSIEKEANRFEERVQEEVIDPMVGRTVKLEAREARDEILHEARTKIAKHESNVRKLINSPAYRTNLRQEITKRLLQNPSIQKMIQDRQQIPQEVVTHQPRDRTSQGTTSMPEIPDDRTTRVARALPLAAAGIAALVILGS